MQKQTLRLRKRSASRFLFPLASTGLVLLFLLVIFPLVPEIKLASATIDNTVYGLELATNPSINLSIQPTSNGTISVAKDTVTANTNSPSGYKLYLSVNKDLDNSIYLNGDTNNDSASTKFIPTTGTYESPSALTQNSWGYAVAGLNSFDVSYTNPTATSKFANLPTANNEQLIHDHSGVATDDATDIYYGVKADINIASGNYSTELLYTTISDASSEVNGEATITPSQVNNGYTATELTITTSLVTNKNLGTISAMIGNVACEDIELVTNNPVTITCTLPAGLVGGKYNVALNIPNLGKSYTIENGFEVSPQVTANIASSSTGYGTISNNGFIAPYGTPITTNGNTITIGDQTITATPAAQTTQYTYAFSSWTNNCGVTVTGNCTITANFSRTTRSYTITWNANGGSVSPTTTTKEYGTALGTLPTPTYAGYNFDGWFTAASGGSQIAATTTVTGDVTYYAHWTQAMRYMQDVANWWGELGLEEQVQVMDKRDGKVYWVAKLKDDNIWMTQNLDFDITTTNVTPELSDVTEAWTINNTFPPSNTSSSITVDTDRYAVHAYSWDPGDYYWNGIYQNVNTSSSETPVTGYDDPIFSAVMQNSVPENGGEHYHIGNLYQWNAATAGTGASMLTVSSSWEAPGSICPKGWRLPKAKDSNGYSWYALLRKYGNTSEINNFPLYYIPVGGRVSVVQTNHYGAGYGYYGIIEQGGVGFYFGADGKSLSSTSPRSGGLSVGNASANAEIEYGPKDMMAIRCVAHHPGLDSVSAMQDVSPDLVLETEAGVTKQLIDVRDNKKYWVTKLTDGNIWMTQNLDFDITPNNVTPESSNVTTAWDATGYVTLTDDNMKPNGASSYDPGNFYWDGNTWSKSSFLSNDSSIFYASNTAFSTTAPINGGEHYHVGNFYSYKAATAGTGKTDWKADQLDSDSSASGSICPKGWKLPGNLASNYVPGSYNRLLTTYSGVNLSTAPLYFLPAGIGKQSSASGISDIGARGEYQSTESYHIKETATTNANDGSYELLITSTNKNGTFVQGGYGMKSVRCVVDMRY